MCTINEDSELMPIEIKQECLSICKKCGEAAVLVVQIRHSYCRECFLAMAVHKFRAVLGKSKLMNIKDHVAAIFTGMPSSFALLHLLQAGLSEKSHKRFLFSASVIYLDEGAVVGKCSGERKSDLKSAVSYIKSLNFSAYYIKFEDIFCIDNDSICVPLNYETELLLDEDAVGKLQAILKDTSTLTAQEDLLSCLRHKLIRTAAKQINANKVFLDLCGTELAIKIMSDVAVGRGLQLHYNVGFCDARDPDMKILRPMRDLSAKEIAYYNQFQNIEAFIVTSVNTKAGSHASIQNLAEHFVLDLQENFPSTVSTIFRTGEKLGGRDEIPSQPDEDNCAICDGRLDTSTEVCSSLEATKFSRLISSLGPKGFDNMTMTKTTAAEKEVAAGSNDKCLCRSEQNDAEENPGYCRSTSKVQLLLDNVILSSLCYGCQLIYRDMLQESPKSLPPYVQQAIHKRSNLRKMRNSVQDFLL